MKLAKLTVLVLFAGAGAAMAEHDADAQASAMGDKGTTTATQSFDTLDSNKDGYLTKTEAEAKLGTGDNYGEADRNADGRLDRAEFSAWEMSSPETHSSTTRSIHDSSSDTMDHSSAPMHESSDEATDPNDTMTVP